MNTCRRCLTFWRAVLEHDTADAWFIRFLPDDTIWANVLAREKFGVPETQLWDHAMRWAHHADTHKIEDIYSLALKTMTPQPLSFRFKVTPDKLLVFHTSITPYRCQGCPLHCALVLILARSEESNAGVSDRSTDASGELHP